MLELLNQLDGFEPQQNIKVIMATNRIDILDSALLRPGRIDRKIEFPAPGEDARLDILKIHSRKMNLTRGINLKKIAEMMPGASGAEVKGVCTEAGMYALRERRVHVTQEDFELSVTKVYYLKSVLINMKKELFIISGFFFVADYDQRFRTKHVDQEIVEISRCRASCCRTFIFYLRVLQFVYICTFYCFGNEHTYIYTLSDPLLF